LVAAAARVFDDDFERAFNAQGAISDESSPEFEQANAKYISELDRVIEENDLEESVAAVYVAVFSDE
jgi:hypothetical protein